MVTKPRILALFGSAVLFGQERANIEILSTLKEQGCEILCLVRDESWSSVIPSALEARGINCKRIPYIEHRMPGRLRWILFRNPIAFLIANCRFFKVVHEFRPTHIHAFNQLFTLNFIIGLTLVRTPMVYRAGDEPTVHRWFWRASWRFVLRRSEKFVANSEFTRGSLCMSGVPANRVTVIHNKPPLRAGGKGESVTLSLPPDSRIILYIGQITEHKGVHLLVDAFRNIAKKYPKAALIVAGRISEWRADAWARQLRDTALSDQSVGQRIVFPGHVEDVAGLFARSEIHVVPSVCNESSPNVIMEAKSASKPSVVFPRGGMPELVRHNIDGFVCRDETVTALIDALQHYLADPELAQRHGKAAFTSLDQLGISDFACHWLNIYTRQHIV